MMMPNGPTSEQRPRRSSYDSDATRDYQNQNHVSEYVKSRRSKETQNAPEYRVNVVASEVVPNPPKQLTVTSSVAHVASAVRADQNPAQVKHDSGYSQWREHEWANEERRIEEPKPEDRER